jgi:hypothetical protein
MSNDVTQPSSDSSLKETLLVGSLASLLLLVISWPAFKYFFFGEAFWPLRIYNENGRHLWRAAFSRIDGMFFRPGFFLAQIGWDFILPANPTVYHIRNFAFCVLNIFLLHRVLLKFVRSREARIIALSIFAASKIHLTIIGYVNIYESSILLMTILLTVLFWFRYIEERRTLDYVLTVAMCVFSVYSKDNGFIIIGILAAMTIVHAMKPTDVMGQVKYWSVRFIPFVIALASYLVLRYILTGPLNPNNPIYSPRLSLRVAVWQATAFLATVGNFTLTNSGSMGERGLSSLILSNSRTLEIALVALVWLIIIYTLWVARSSWTRLLVPLVWIGLYLAPVFLIRNHQVYYYQEPLVGLVLLIGISLERANRALLITWVVIVVLIVSNGFLSNRRSLYDWEYTAQLAEKVKPFVDSQRSNPPKSIVFMTSAQQRDLWVFTLREPFVPHLLGSPNTNVRIADRALIGYDPASETFARPQPNDTVFFDVDKGAAVVPRTTQNQGNTGPQPTTREAPTATIKAEPNPIRVCDGSGLGITTISYTLSEQEVIEVHIDSPDGPLFARQGISGTATTGKWVSEGMVFYLQDVSSGKSLTAENTLATVRVSLTTVGCQ